MVVFVTRHVLQLFKVKRTKVKVRKSRDVLADKNAVTRQWMVISTSNLVGIVNVGVYTVQMLLTVAANATKCSTFEV